MAETVLAVIPARYASERLAGKPLLNETGRTLIEHTWRQVRRAGRIGGVLVATDDERILLAARGFGAEAVLTSPACRSGTDRVAEAVRGRNASLIVNVQGDEPEVDPAALDRLIRRMEGDDAAMGTLASPLSDAAAIVDPHRVKVVTDARGRALYFSRAPIPFARDGHAEALLHIGVYAFRPAFLDAFARWPTTPLEATERLEQLRALEHGAAIAVEVVPDAAWCGIDTRADYEAFVRRWKAGGAV